MNINWFSLLFCLGWGSQILPSLHAANPIPVTADNFVRAESDLYMAKMVKDGGFAKFVHRREPAAIEDQAVIRLNRDTLYSFAIFDLNAGTVTIVLPYAGERFMSLQVINEDHYVPLIAYDAGTYVIDRKLAGTRYVLVGIRTLVNPADPKDLEVVQKLQNDIKELGQKDPGKFEIPDWDPVTQKKIREALLVLAGTLPDSKGMFGAKDEVDEARHLIGSASAWGGNPEKDAIYLSVTPVRNDGKMPYILTVKDVPVGGFWSVSVYNAKGYFEPNSANAYSLNNLTSKKNGDGSTTIHFGGDDKLPNYLPIMKGWNYLVRLYRPKQEILDGSWKFPEAQVVK